jgi:hypothetical protein
VSHKDLPQPTKDNISQTSKRTRKMIKTSQFGNSEAQEIKKQETLVRFSIISYNTRLRVLHLQKKI